MLFWVAKTVVPATAADARAREAFAKTGVAVRAATVYHIAPDETLLVKLRENYWMRMTKMDNLSNQKLTETERVTAAPRVRAIDARERAERENMI